VSAARLWVRKRVRQGQQVLAFEGEINGSTACHALERLAGTPPQAREIVLDLSGVTIVDPFGLDVLSRGLSRLGRGRRIRIQASPEQLPLLASLTGGLVRV
jgi:anti-anti-sigma regulatory factor